MLQPLLLGALLGLFSGIVPGPFSALIAANALERGFRAGARIALVPLVSETGVLVLAALLLSQVPDQALRWMGITGGVLVALLSVRTWRGANDPPNLDDPGPVKKRLLEGMALAVLSPAPWVFWLLVGGPLFLSAWNRGWAPGLGFLGSFLVCFVGVYVGLAAVSAGGRRVLSAKGYARTMRGAAVAMALAGAVLAWQSWVGNFHRMVQGAETIRAIVEDSIPGSDGGP